MSRLIQLTSQLAQRGLFSLIPETTQWNFCTTVEYRGPLKLGLNGRNISTSAPAWTKQSTTTEDSKAAKNEEDIPVQHNHFRLDKNQHPLGQDFVDAHRMKVSSDYWDNPTKHQIYTPEEIKHVQVLHHQPEGISDRVALFAVKLMRSGFDFVSRYKGPGGKMTREAWLHRCLFLETVAGVPGMVAGMARHLKSLRSMRRDNGWIHTLLAEAENERMHLLIFMSMKDPSLPFRFMVIMGQGVFFNAFFFTYLISPRTCHRFVGYLEEEAVKTYTGLMKDVGSDGHLSSWGAQPAPQIAIQYYKLPSDARVIDVVGCVRADEATHRDVNHTFAALDTKTGKNPFIGHEGKVSKKPL